MKQHTAPKSLVALVSRSLLTYSVLISLLFLLGIVSLYRDRLQEQQSDAAARINLLLQVSLENAMLKRDIPGLMDIVDRLGKQDGIASVMILNPQGEVRFSSDPQLISRRFDLTKPELCSECAWDGKKTLETSELLAKGLTGIEPVLRSIKTVANQPECAQCHGAASVTPFNGLLVVDHQAGDLRRKAILGALALAGSGMVVMLGLMAGLYWLLKRNVLTPVAQLTEASSALASGDLTRRVGQSGSTELAQLGDTFNEMARRLQNTLVDLRARERFVQDLLDSLPDGVRVIDQNFRVILANKAYSALLQLQGSATGAFCYASAHGRTEPCIPTLVTCPLVVLRQPGAHIKYHSSYKRANGDAITVEVNAVHVQMQTGEQPQSLVIEVIRDLDAQVQISHEQRLSELGQLATGVAHEIRNPLSSVDMLLADARANLAANRAADVDASLRLIAQEVERCLAITDSLLKLGTPPDSQPQLILLNDVVGDILRLLHFQAEESRIVIDLAMDAALRVLSSDSDLRIVMINLIQNAFHAMPDGGRLSIAGKRTGDGNIILSFTDTGVGIAHENLRAIFMPFWSRRADGVHGTGLGLSICQSIIRSLQGDITVASVPGAGATFTITLPDADDSKDVA